MPVPAIAIHASGPRGKIAPAVDANFRNSALYHGVKTVEFDWDGVVPRTSTRGLRNLYRFLRRYAANISAASHLGMEFSAHYVDELLGALQVRLHRVLQWMVPGLVAMLAVIPVAKFVVLAPAAWYGLPTLAFPPAGWLAAAVRWTNVGVAAGFTTLIVLGLLRLLVTLSPRPVIITFRSIAVLLLQPLLILATGAFVADSLLLWMVFGVFGVSSFFVVGAGALALWAAIFGILLGLRARWARGALQGPLKLVLDVFRYLGEPGYRSRIQQALDKAIHEARQRAGEQTDFVLVGQGLGTVIALDSILHSRTWGSGNRVLLVTMGSPLRRYFLSLYPRILFPESMEDVVDLVAGRLSEFRWMNVYRPGDYVGGALGLAPFSGRDVSTGQRRRVIGGHADYWLDIEARRALHNGLQRITEVKALHLPMKDAAHRMPHPRHAAADFRVPSPARTVVGATVSLATLGGMLWWVATGLGVLGPGTDDQPELLERGIVVAAAATHRRETMVQARGLTYVHHWEFAFTDPTGAARNLHVARDARDAFLDIPHPFDDRALTQRIRARCAGTEGPAWWPQEMEVPCTLEGVRLRYYPGDVTFFDLPDFPRQRFGGDPVRGWTEAGLVAGALATLALIPVVFGVRLFVILAG